MLNSSLAMEREFSPRYSTTWYLGLAVSCIIIIAYVRSNLVGETLNHIIDMVVITAAFFTISAVFSAVTRIEFGARLVIRRVLWFPTRVSYDQIAEVRLPEIEIKSAKPIKLDNIVNLDELQQIFKDCQIIGVIPKDGVRDIKVTSKYTTQLSWKKVLGGIFALIFGLYLIYGLSGNISIFWIVVVFFYVFYDVFEKLFKKAEHE